MRTRRSRGLRQTRKGGKTSQVNRSNWEKYWQKQYPDYDPMMNYPGLLKQMYKNPNEFNKLTTPNTYIIQRHGFSCANLEKAKDKNSWHFRVADPSLTSYGIYSLLYNQVGKRKPDGFNGTIFGSSLIRTWQTGLLEYGKYEPLTIVVSPYIKEKHGIAGDLSNMPLPFEQQMAQMEEFMTFLKGIDHDIAREIIIHKHKIKYGDKLYSLGKSYVPPVKITTPIPQTSSQQLFQQFLRGEVPSQPYKPEYKYESQGPYIDELKNKKVLKPAVSTKPKQIKENVFIPDISVIPRPSYHEYYGAKGFVYFDHWVRENYPDMETIFVVSHSGWMQKVIEGYCGVVETKIFDENAWKLKITPVSPGIFNFEIMRGIPKPTDNELEYMNRAEEPTCHLVPRPRTRPQPVTPIQPNPLHAQPSQSLQPPQPSQPSQSLQPPQPSQPSQPPQPSQPSQPPQPPQQPPQSQASLEPDEEAKFEEERHAEPVSFSNLEQIVRPRSDSQSSQGSQSSLNTEATPVQSKIKSVPVNKTEKTEVITRSYTELVHMLCDRSLSTGLNALMASIDKASVIQYISSDPYVTISDPTDTSYFNKRKVSIYLFENHYLLFILLCKSYFDTFVHSLETSDSRLTKSILSLFNITVPIPTVVAFLKGLRQLIEDDADVYHLLLSKCARNVNKPYAFKQGRVLLSLTLLDLFMYELDVFPVTEDTIEFMYKCIIDLVRYGARCSTVIYSQDAPVSLVEMTTGIELPSTTIVPFKMPVVELDFLPDERGILQRWEEAKRTLDPQGILAQLQARYTDAKRRYRLEERKVQIAYNKEKYQIDKLGMIHQQFLEKNKALLDELEQIKTAYREAKSKISQQWLETRDKMNDDFEKAIFMYLNPLLIDHLDFNLISNHKEILKRLIAAEYTEASVSLGGVRGTSWKKSLLRQSSVKAARYRASLYKGKRRTRANRS